MSSTQHCATDAIKALPVSRKLCHCFRVIVSGPESVSNDDGGADSDCNASTGNGSGQFSKKQRKAR